MKLAVSILTIVLGVSGSFAEERRRLEDVEKVVFEKLKCEKQREFFEMFFFTTTGEHQDAIRAEVRDLFARHFRSGIGRVTVWRLKDEDFHREVMGEVKAGDLYRAPGPPFAYLNVFPADKADPEYMGLNFRVAKIDGETRIVFPECKPGVPQFLNGSVSTWTRSEGGAFEGRLVRVIDGVAHFRTHAAELLLINLKKLTARDRERIALLTAKGGQIKSQDP